ncbi:hypothetical protein CROQUDRAFT_99186 [Cronartium quercuum f. sp. fusiforme G11]|uniref:AMP-dependent synthetase/ligase domain-containing protein n=1 Tax=Cronartium quercuum f. sp. fusiforme G11 TaxID=708437 RepID=A0A9P6T708_9BASI|nr:hypothetical protein CROQUDRAFT_99186 [Cronartium quercuum f. sp. fusiforme G11]
MDCLSSANQSSLGLFDFLFSNPFYLNFHQPVLFEASQTQSNPIPIYPHSLRAIALTIAKNLNETFDLHPASAHSTDPNADIISPVVMICLPNGVPFVSVLLGTLAAGLTLTLANPALKPQELCYMIATSKPVLIVGLSLALQNIRGAINLASLDYQPEIILVEDSKLSPNVKTYTTLLTPKEQGGTFKMDKSETRRRIALILWTSGTSTGKPKAIKLSHHALTFSVSALSKIHPQYRLRPQRFTGFAPFYHIFGVTNVLFVAITIGATIFIEPKFNLGSFLKLIKREKITQLHLSPPVAAMLGRLKDIKKQDFVSVTSAVSGGAPLEGDLVEDVWRKTGIWIKIGYGLSETSGVTHQIGDTIDEERLGCAGVPLEGVEVRIEGGEILVKSESMMNGYLGEGQVGSKIWFRTGDLGLLDRSGHLWITGRVKELMKVKGYQVSPSELEAFIRPIEHFQESVVGAVYDPEQASEFPRAYIVPLDQNLKSICQSTSLANSESVTNREQFACLAQLAKQAIEANCVNYKWLRGGVIFIDEIPKSDAGKILRRALGSKLNGVLVKIYDHQPRRDSRL